MRLVCASVEIEVSRGRAAGTQPSYLEGWAGRGIDREEEERERGVLTCASGSTCTDVFSLQSLWDCGCLDWGRVLIPNTVDCLHRNEIYTHSHLMHCSAH